MPPVLLRFAFLAALCLAVAPASAQTEEEIDGWFARAEEALKRGRDERALEHLERLLKAVPDDAEALDLAVRALRNLGRWDEAEARAEAWLKAAPDAREARLARAALHGERGRDDAALELLKPLLTPREGSDSAPRLDFRAHALAAALHESRGRDEAARAVRMALVDEAKRVVVRAPEDLVALAEAYVAFGGPREAEKALIEAQKRAEDEVASPSIALGELYLNHLYVPGDAVAEFERALKIRPNAREALAGLVAAFEEWQKADRAEGHRRTLRLIDANHPDLLAREAQNALGNAAFAAAEQALAKLFLKDRQDRNGLALRAALVWMRDGSAAGEQAIEEFLRVDPTYGRGLTRIAEVLNQRRRWPEALELSRRATMVAKDDPEVWDHRARYAFFLGLDREGMDALRKADQSDRFSHVWRRNMFEVRRVLSAYYDEVPTPRFIHRFHRRERPAFAPLAVPFAEESFDLLVQKYGYKPEGLAAEDHQGRILVEWFRETDSFSARTLGFTNFGALGVCFGPFIGMNSPGSREPGQFSWSRTFHHELAHSLTVGLSRGRTTRWMTEGLSTYEELAYDPAWDRGLYRELHDALESDSLFSIEDFDAGFGTPRVIFAYFQAGLAMQYIANKHGMAKVRTALEAYGQDLSTSALWPRVFGQSAREFDQEFAAAMRELLRGTKLLARWPAERMKPIFDRLDAGQGSAEDAVLGAIHLVQRGRGLDALGLVQSARSMGSKDPRLDAVQGFAAAAQGAIADAQAHFERALQAGFDDFELRLRRAEWAQKAGDLARGEAELRRALELFPKVALGEDPRLALIALLEERGEKDEAIRLREEHLARNFENLKVREELLAIYRERKDDPSSLRHLRAWMHIDPLRAERLQELAEVEARAGDARLSARAYEALLGLLTAPADAALEPGREIALRLARAEQIARLTPADHPAARTELERILALDPEHPGAKSLLERLAPGPAPEGGRPR